MTTHTPMGISTTYHLSVDFSSFKPKVYFRAYKKYQLHYERRVQTDGTCKLIYHNSEEIYKPLDLFGNVSEKEHDKFNPKLYEFENKEEQYYTYPEKSCLSYIVWEESLTKDELAELSTYCQCIKCQSWNPLVRIFACACCVRCLKSDSASEDVIYNTRKYISDNHYSWMSPPSYFLGLS